MSDAMLDSYESMKVHYAGIEDRAKLSLQDVVQEWEETGAELEDFYANVSEKDWRAKAAYPTDEPTDLGGMLEIIVVAPPRPLYRHLPVHIPDTEAYLRQLRG